MWTKENIPDQKGKIAIVTGANAGIGYETALALYEAGAQVVLACRDLERAGEAVENIKRGEGKGSVEAVLLDLSSLDAIADFANNFKEKHSKLNILINNAGVMMTPESKTAEGYELQFGVNFLGHYALTGHLYPLLKSTPGSRVVTLSSNAYLRGIINFDNLKSEVSYDPVREYGQSKLGNIIFSLELQRRIELAGDHVLSIAVQPGANKTDLARHMDAESYAAAVERIGSLMEPWQGALPSLLAATAPDVSGGEFYEPEDRGYRGYPVKGTIQPHATDLQINQKLWTLAENATDIRYF